MTRWSVVFAPVADRTFTKLSREVQTRVLLALERYADTGAGQVVQLTGREGEFRLRVGDYRVVFERHADRLVVLVLRVGHRREVYRG